jgi:hypothetical protein
MALVRRVIKGTPLTFAEGDANLVYLEGLATNTGSFATNASVTNLSSSLAIAIAAATNEQNLGFFATTGSNIFQGSQTISGSIAVTGNVSASGFSGSFNGTGSYAISASYTTTASFSATATTATTSSFAQNFTVANNINITSGSINIATGSISIAGANILNTALAYSIIFG